MRLHGSVDDACSVRPPGQWKPKRLHPYRHNVPMRTWPSQSADHRCCRATRGSSRPRNSNSPQRASSAPLSRYARENRSRSPSQRSSRPYESPPPASRSRANIKAMPAYISCDARLRAYTLAEWSRHLYKRLDQVIDGVLFRQTQPEVEILRSVKGLAIAARLLQAIAPDHHRAMNRRRF